MGTLTSVQLLLLSGVGNTTELDKLGIPAVHELPGVGKNLLDHVLTTVVWSVNQNPFPIPVGSIVDESAWNLYNKNRIDILASIRGHTNIFLRTRFQTSNDLRHDLQVIATTLVVTVCSL